MMILFLSVMPVPTFLTALPEGKSVTCQVGCLSAGGHLMRPSLLAADL